MKEVQNNLAGSSPGQSELTLAHIVSICTDAVVIIDEDHIIQFFNPGAEQVFGYQASEVLGKPLDLLLPARYTESHRNQIHRFADSSENAKLMAARMEVAGRRKDGVHFPAEASICKWTQNGKRFFAAILRDIADRKSLEAQFLHAQKMESVGRLAGGVAHDFNNLLTALVGYTELLEDKVLGDEEALVYIRNIRKATERAINLTAQLLAFARKENISTRIVNLNALLMSVSEMLQQIIGEDISVVTRYQPDLGLIEVDPGQMEQVIVNLAVNARDAMPRGGTLSIETANVTIGPAHKSSATALPPGDYVRLSVRDTGIGIEEAIRCHLFEPFFTTKGLGKGTGLGLATCYSIVKQSGGDIYAESHPGKGSAFHVCLPRVEGEVTHLAQESHRVLPRGSETLLLVEDEACVRDIAAAELRRQGYTVIEAAAGDEALRKVEHLHEPIPLLVTDVILPGMNGRELAESLQSAGRVLKVLYISGYTDNILNHDTLNSEVALLQKPFTSSMLARKVRETLNSDAP